MSGNDGKQANRIVECGARYFTLEQHALKMISH